ncbi:MAG TPA: response regulator [Azospirillaceae bacterium]|nr:response regulator [Azospirillaceae bacterium]
MPHILLAEDELLIREMFGEALADAGFRVTRARDGADALARFREEPADIIVTDFSMPVMNGAGLLQAARAIRPGTPGLIVTGYSHEVGDLEAMGDGDTRLMNKPVSPAALVRTVRQLLDAA